MVEFNIKQTNIAKGVAILLMLWHHLFYDVPDNYNLFVSFWMLGSVPIECVIARYCKVCVAIYVILSGFGLYMSWNKFFCLVENRKHRIISQIIFVKNHLLKLMFNFWFIFIIFVPMGVFFGRKFWGVYGINPINAFVDFIGLFDMFSMPTMNVTWWFMSVIIILYILFPIIVRIMSFSSELMLSIAAALIFLPGLSSCPLIGKYFVWIFPFVIGMYFAKYKGMEFIYFHNIPIIKGLFFTGIMIVACVCLRYAFNQTTDFDSIFALSIILFSYLVLSKIPVVCKVLENLGKQSGAIFFFFSFFVEYYFKGFVYLFKYPLIIFAVLTVTCYIVSVGLKYLKKITRYEKLEAKAMS